MFISKTIIMYTHVMWDDTIYSQLNALAIIQDMHFSK